MAIFNSCLYAYQRVSLIFGDSHFGHPNMIILWMASLWPTLKVISPQGLRAEKNTSNPYSCDLFNPYCRGIAFLRLGGFPALKIHWSWWEYAWQLAMTLFMQRYAQVSPHQGNLVCAVSAGWPHSKSHTIIVESSAILNAFRISKSKHVRFPYLIPERIPCLLKNESAWDSICHRSQSTFPLARFWKTQQVELRTPNIHMYYIYIYVYIYIFVC